MKLIKRYARVSPDLDIYYEEAGTGTPIIFNPGWIGTTEFFHQQLAHFSKHYRAISYDPRSHGRSSNTLENNNYLQHGADLGAFIATLGQLSVIRGLDINKRRTKTLRYVWGNSSHPNVGICLDSRGGAQNLDLRSSPPRTANVGSADSSRCR